MGFRPLFMLLDGLLLLDQESVLGLQPSVQLLLAILLLPLRLQVHPTYATLRLLQTLGVFTTQTRLGSLLLRSYGFRAHSFTKFLYRWGLHSNNTLRDHFQLLYHACEAHLGQDF